MSRLRQERGFTLVELMVTMSLMIVVLGGAVAAFSTFSRSEVSNQRQNDAQDQARQTLDVLVRQLRNLASPTEYLPKAVELNKPYDFVFQTVDAKKASGSQNDRNIKRVRYCLGESSNGKATLWSQQQTWVAPNPPPTFPSVATCPSTAWPTQTALNANVVSREKNEPVFTYNAAEPASVTSVGAQLFVDIDPARAPAASKLASGVFLRNQNRAPVAAFTATYTGTGGRVLLNGSASEDPEGHALETFEWEVDGTKIPTKGIVVYWEAPGPGAYTFKLTVKDHAGLEGTATSGGVVVP
jgi:prepilin-type N-terminal cleavage/methylation domain-containing protein